MRQAEQEVWLSNNRHQFRYCHARVNPKKIILKGIGGMYVHWLHQTGIGVINLGGDKHPGNP